MIKPIHFGCFYEHGICVDLFVEVGTLKTMGAQKLILTGWTRKIQVGICNCELLPTRYWTDGTELNNNMLLCCCAALAARRRSTSNTSVKRHESVWHARMVKIVWRK